MNRKEIMIKLCKTELIVFIHIAKTGGTTLRNILNSQYPDNSIFLYMDKTNKKLVNEEKLLQLLQKHINSAKAISGHFGFEMKYEEIIQPLLPRIKKNRDITYISMIRKPVDQIFSLFHHYKRNNWIASEITFDMFVTNKLYQLNYQTLCISGGNIPDIQQAKKNITKDFAVLGVTDMYKESLFLMKERFNWENKTYKKENVFVNAFELTHISSKIKQQIEQDNALDCQLYRFARSVLKKKIKKLDSYQKKELITFSPFV
ncbi:sulfotransferase family protein [Bacillus cereus]|uniref:hypothetical protein n=1 Tax=Bacillus cereus TaxID=1396 RepID=UPI003980369A